MVQPTKKKTSASGTRVTVGAPYVAADKPNVEGKALTVLDRAVLLPRALIQRQVQTHHLKHMTCACACQYVHRPMQDDAQVHAVVRIVAARAELDPRRGPWQVQPHHDELNWVNKFDCTN